MHSDFTLFLREYPNGKKVYFYYAYDGDGERRGPWTTKCLKKTAARNYCHSLLKKGELLPDRDRIVTFGEFAEGFWERGSAYVRNQESRADITDNYIVNCRRQAGKQIVPFFADVPLDKITDKDVNDWLMGFRERKTVKDGKTEIVSYKNTYANSVFGTLSVMLGEAVRRGLIPSNPCDKVKKLKNDRKSITILTADEVKRLFPKNYEAVWGDKFVAYAANRLASITGMRIGEILGLRGEYVYDDYIYVCGQYGESGYLPHTKTKENRNIPLMPEMIGLLKKLMKTNGKGYVFSLDGGVKAVCPAYVRDIFYGALEKIGIGGEERNRRGLTMHGWRHFLNTELLRQGLSVKQVQGVTGHKSERMTELYNHPDARQITDVIKAQETIAGNDDNDGCGNPDVGLKIVRLSDKKTA